MQSEFLQTPAAKLVDIGNNTECVLVLEDWNVEDAAAGYNEEEVKGLIEMLQQSLDIMSRYNRANDKLPLFEDTREDNSNVQQYPPYIERIS